jgi:DNA-binding MarR family transcriptional regulator
LVSLLHRSSFQDYLDSQENILQCYLGGASRNDLLLGVPYEASHFGSIISSIRCWSCGCNRPIDRGRFADCERKFGRFGEINKSYEVECAGTCHHRGDRYWSARCLRGAVHQGRSKGAIEWAGLRLRPRDVSMAQACGLGSHQEGGKCSETWSKTSQEVDKEKQEVSAHICCPSDDAGDRSSFQRSQFRSRWRPHRTHARLRIMSTEKRPKAGERRPDEVVGAISELIRAEHRHAAHLGLAMELPAADTLALYHLANEPLTASDLGDRLGLTSGSVTALINRLIARQLAHRKRSETDGRVVFVELTTSGRQESWTALSSFVLSVERAAQELTAQEREIVITFVQNLVAMINVDTERQKIRG